ncbi:hypothetical protein C9J48_10965 [Photobacterium profundum]|uniref:Uncharacterized protein n=1 Tax=Photobacterium profundum 3TCK TaxID=314280 RepID=Q1YWV6_9GAMM|nr:hypothetical protein [Photobacterium profundum]EAS40746.1 hypothetical protein P3TCK_08668 [Photobacterium profundum 3TCK]PSV62475.1 hypothetical protein C9J48_10965 [Photobacterium profundum]
MAVSIPKWAADAAIVVLIFSVGAYSARVEFTIKELNKQIEELKTKSIPELDKKLAVQEGAISIHHGSDWSKRVEDNSLLKVVDLENKFNKSVSELGNDFNTNSKSIINVQIAIEAAHLWAKQQDKRIRDKRLEQFRALAVYSTAKSNDTIGVYINKQHTRGGDYKKGDHIVLINPLPPGLQVEVIVKGFLDDPASSNILVQLNEKLLVDIGLTTRDGQYELFIQNDSDILRWKKIEDVYKELIDKESTRITRQSR